MKWIRHFYPMCVPLGEDGRLASGSEKHALLSRQAACEGAVLLKNQEGALPLKSGSKVVLLGKASEEYVKGGGGSGDVTVRSIRSLYEGMKIKQSEGKVSVYDGLHDFYADNIRNQYETEKREPGLTVEPELSEAQWKAAAAFSDTAILSICRFSGEGWDRHCTSNIEMSATAAAELWDNELERREAGKSLFRRGDFYLSDGEELLFRQAKQYFKHILVVLNVGGMVDTQWFIDEPQAEAVLYVGQGGMEGGLAAADLICGDATPCGKLSDTFAKDLADYPSTPGFHDSQDYVEYTEDIYVGYRYFETVPGAAEKVNYPFGFGLSYTSFEICVESAAVDMEQVCVSARVKNVGSCSGKEVLQLYVQAPQGLLGKPSRQLCAFAKTPLLAPGESCTVTLTAATDALASYDDTGKVCKSAWILEKGCYRFHLGTSVRDTEELGIVLELQEDAVVCRLSEKLKPRKLTRRMRPDGSFEPMEQGEYEELKRPEIFYKPQELEALVPEVRFEKRSYLQHHENTAKQFADVAEGKLTLDEFMDDLSAEELVWLLGGQPNTGVANTFGMGNNRNHGVPNIMTADGPAGVRIHPHLGVYTTAWPCATTLACTWNTELVNRIGQAAAVEVKENNIGIWLAPGMNIHRSPLCGRNFEYYSEDPLIAGKMGAAMISGVQSRKIAATPKHFACNNKETNRKHSDSRVSERAAREIYLKGFEIAVKEADPWLIMSSYNLVNGHYSSENKELLTDVLRGEWGFNGIVTTDWWTRGEHWREVKAGNDVKMANGFPEDVLAALEDGRLTMDEVRACAKRVLEMILKME